MGSFARKIRRAQRFLCSECRKPLEFDTEAPPPVFARAIKDSSLSRPDAKQLIKESVESFARGEETSTDAMVLVLCHHCGALHVYLHQHLVLFPRHMETKLPASFQHQLRAARQTIFSKRRGPFRGEIPEA